MRKHLLLAAVGLLALTCESEARTSWRFYAGGWMQKGFEGNYSYEDNTDKSSRFNIWAGMDVQFIIKEKFHIETGVNYRNRYVAYGDEFLYSDIDNFVSVPLRFGYRLALDQKNSFEFGVGPYAAYGVSSGVVHVGLSPVVTYKHRALSLSFHYENPVFRSEHDKYRNQFAITVGVNFNGRSPNWDNIITGLDVANAALSAASQTMSAYSESQGGGSNSNSDGYNDGAGYSSNSGSSYSSKGSSSSSGNFSISEQTDYNSDKRAYERWDSLLSKHFYGNGNMSDSSVREAGQKMKSLRQKWESRGKSFPHSGNEDKALRY